MWERFQADSPGLNSCWTKRTAALMAALTYIMSDNSSPEIAQLGNWHRCLLRKRWLKRRETPSLLTTVTRLYAILRDLQCTADLCPGQWGMMTPTSLRLHKLYNYIINYIYFVQIIVWRPDSCHSTWWIRMWWLPMPQDFISMTRVSLSAHEFVARKNRNEELFHYYI